MKYLFCRTDLCKLNWYIGNRIPLLTLIIKLKMYFTVHIFGLIHNKITEAVNLLKANNERKIIIIFDQSLMRKYFTIR